MISIKLAFDSGWTDGNPGDGRCRVDGPNIRKVSHLYVNALDRHEAELGELLASFKLGDVVALTRDSGGGQMVAWIVGPVVHRGGYYRIPIRVCGVDGGFAAHDLVQLHRLEEQGLVSSPGASVAYSATAPAPVAPESPSVTERRLEQVPAPHILAPSGMISTPILPTSEFAPGDRETILNLMATMAASLHAKDQEMKALLARVEGIERTEVVAGVKVA